MTKAVDDRRRKLAGEPSPTEQLLVALKAAERMIDVALPQFNWGASCLSAEAIALLNETPGVVRAAIRRAEAGNAS